MVCYLTKVDIIIVLHHDIACHLRTTSRIYYIRIYFLSVISNLSDHAMMYLQYDIYIYIQRYITYMYFNMTSDVLL